MPKRILFLIGAASRIRNFDHTIAALVERGHSVQLTGRLRNGSFELPPGLQHERLSARVNPTERVDAWRDLVDLLRGGRDYVRYFDPRFARATRLVRRAYEIAPTDVVLFCERHPWVKRHWRSLSRLLAVCEQLIPTDPGFEAFVREQRPDLVVVTPLVTFESYQTDYVKAAHRLGIPVAFIPFSWDNLTNKGLMRIHPDRTLVWNDIQRQEAIELHGCAPDSVVVTGAARFDDFFARRPSLPRPEFMARYGLDPARPMVLYVGSSQLTGPNEMELLRRWAESLRAADDPLLRTCGILVRPHPALSESWAALDLSDLGGVAVTPQTSRRGADQELFDSLHHAHAAVGLNTSAMLEAAIVGRPVLTLVIPGFDEGQVGTIHFRYLVEAFGGLATVANGFDEHRQQLSAVVQGEAVVSARSRAFAERFLRPHGIDRSVAGILASEIERAATVVRRPTRTPLWHHPARAALRSALRRRTASRASAVETTVVGTSMSLRPVKTALEEIQQGKAPLFVGPWGDSVANELLYWIPFVRWAVSAYGLPPERLIVISRDGVSGWYGSIARRYLDGPELFSRSELDHWTRRTVPQSQQNPKQAVISPFDQEIVERAARALDLADYQVLHPIALFRILLRVRKDRAWSQLTDVLTHQRLDAAAWRAPDRLPASFVAVSGAFTGALPDSPDNRRVLNELIARAAAKANVVLVDIPRPAHLDAHPRMRLIEEFAGDRPPLQVQTAVLAKARGFIGPYGDLAVLAASCGTPSTAYHTERLPVDHVERAQAAVTSGGWAPLLMKRASRVKDVRSAVASTSAHE